MLRLGVSTRGLSTTVTRDLCLEGDAVARVLSATPSSVLLVDGEGDRCSLFFLCVLRFPLWCFFLLCFFRFSFFLFLGVGDRDDRELLPSRLCERERFTLGWRSSERSGEQFEVRAREAWISPCGLRRCGLRRSCPRSRSLLHEVRRWNCFPQRSLDLRLSGLRPSDPWLSGLRPRPARSLRSSRYSREEP